MLLTKKHAFRLLKLADHLESGKMAHKVFDFSTFNSANKDDVCGTAGCAIGECPAVWPERFRWIRNKSASWGEGMVQDVQNPEETEPGLWARYSPGRQFFGLTQRAYAHLFMPRQQTPATFGGEVVWSQEGDDEKAQVISNIRAFVARFADCPIPD